MLDPSMFATSEDSSDSSEETEISEIHISGRLMNVDSVSEGIMVHLDYPQNIYPYFKLFLTNTNTNEETIIIQNVSEGQNDIGFVPVSLNNCYRVTLYVYSSEINLKKNISADSEKIIINAIGGTGEYTFTSPASKAQYDDTSKTLSFNTVSSSNTLYNSRQNFDLYIYTLTPMVPVNGQTDLTELTILEKYSNLKVITASDNTYDVSQVLQEYCEENNLASVQFGLLEKMQFRKAGESNYLYEIIYYDTVFSRHDPYTYTKIQQAP